MPVATTVTHTCPVSLSSIVAPKMMFVSSVAALRIASAASLTSISVMSSPPAIESRIPLAPVISSSISGERNARWLESWGFYLYGQYDWTKRLATGLRYDWTELLTATGHAWALSPYLQFRPSEFLRFRLQYKRSGGVGLVAHDANELFLQGTFIMGAHPTERF